jgi:Lectin C-type domain
MWSEPYTIGHNEGMRSRPAFALVLAMVACDASLGPDNTSQDATIVVDGRSVDATPIDASVDARPCTGGTVAATAPDGSCLVHVTSPVTYAGAKVACSQMGAHLALLKTSQLDTFAEALIGTFDTWIGGSDAVTEGTFLWDDGTAFSFTNWHTGEPNNGGGGGEEDCVIIAGQRVGKQWDDRPCDSSEVPTSGTFAFLCQY